MSQRDHDGAMAYGDGFENDDPAMDLAGMLQEEQAADMVIEEDSFGHSHRRPQVGDEAGRLLSDDDGVMDNNPDATAEWADEDDDMSAEEAAMHIVSDDALSPGSPNDGYLSE
jgi:hypothetical protein